MNTVKQGQKSLKNKSKNGLVKGFNDYVGKDALKRRAIVRFIEDVFLKYGFEPAETPIIENEDFVRAAGGEGDEAVRDVFKLQDRGKRELALRYEFTFQLKRLAKNQKLPFKRYQIGYNFRDEPIRQGRTRQFIQADADIVGATLNDDAECLLMAKNILDGLGIDFVIEINSRKLMNEILEKEKIEEKFREDVIREIDKLDKLDEKKVLDNLKKYGAEKLLKIFKKPEKDFEKYSYFKDIKDLKKLCRGYGVSVKFSPSLARGFSYYNGIVFEVKAKGIGVSVAGGGSYMIDKTQATGISFGVEPLFLISNVDDKIDKINYMVLSINQDKEAIKVAESLREKGFNVQLILDKSISKALEYANSKGIEKVVFVGSDEVKKKKFKVKDLASGKEEILN